MSAGNAGISIDLNKYPTTLIQGASGNGKSTFMEALCFGLYGKAFRNINKGQLINSVNQKNLLVTVEFETGGVDYKIVRGMKPNIFEIYCNGSMINQDAALKDYQRVLEQQILMMTYKTFTQISIIGSSAYIPFMELPTAGRREVIEDILDIGVFSSMNQLLKTHIQETKELQFSIVNTLTNKKDKVETLQNLVSILSSKQQHEIEETKKHIEKLTKEISFLESENDSLENEKQPLIEQTKKLSVLNDAKDKLSESITLSNSQIKRLQQQLAFFSDNDLCHVCKQRIEIGHKEKMENSLKRESSIVNEKLIKYREIEERVKEEFNKMDNIISTLNCINDKQKEISTKIELLQKQELRELNILEEKSNVTGDIKQSKKDIKQLAVEIIDLIEKRKKLATDREIQETTSSLLKDSGIKSSIVREYLPLINNLLNKHLADMEMFVSFNLTENFSEIIKSRHRDEFTYGNFSAGEALRIDLALLFTWRHISKIKNSAACNILILDEILVGRLDQQNSDIVINLLNKIAQGGTSIFAISHGDALRDKFSNVIEFEKRNDFSVMVEND